MLLLSYLSIQVGVFRRITVEEHYGNFGNKKRQKGHFGPLSLFILIIAARITELDGTAYLVFLSPSPY